MRIERKIAARYAEALLGATRTDPERARSELEQVQRTLEAMPQLKQVLQHPEIPGARKAALVNRVFGPVLWEPVLAFLQVLLEHGRMAALPEVVRELADLVAEAEGRVEAHVTSAVPLQPEEEARLTAILSRRTGKRVRLISSVDPAVLAGLAVRMGDRLVDGTARQRLERLREELKTQ